MARLPALWMPILVSAVFVLITLMVVHMMPGWHKRDLTYSVDGLAYALVTGATFGWLWPK
jgi:hypothetical protein